MTRSPNIFHDPLGNNPDYSWAINHSAMSPSGRKRDMTATAPTGIGGDPIFQQGVETPLQLSLSGTLLADSQRQQFILWWQLCRTQTIYFAEFSGETYEVIISDYEETKIGVAANRNDPINMPYHVINYTLVMDVINVLNGDWLGAVP